MKTLATIILFSFFATVNIFGQKNFVNKMQMNDTMKIAVTRVADLLGEYDHDTLQIVKTFYDLRLYSTKRRTLYLIDKVALKSLKKLVNRGLKGKDRGLSYDTYKLTFKTETQTFNLNKVVFDNFMLELKPFRIPGRKFL